MADNLSAADRLKTMRAVKSSNTRLERKLYAMLAGMGLHGWRRHAADVSGKPDVVFPERKLAVFVDGCFWHGCPICERKLPETNPEYWRQKIRRNAERDAQNVAALTADGWRVVRIWEHELKPKADRSDVHKRIRQAIEPDSLTS